MTPAWAVRRRGDMSGRSAQLRFVESQPYRGPRHPSTGSARATRPPLKRCQRQKFVILGLVPRIYCRRQGWTGVGERRFFQDFVADVAVDPWDKPKDDGASGMSPHPRALSTLTGGWKLTDLAQSTNQAVPVRAAYQSGASHRSAPMTVTRPASVRPRRLGSYMFSIVAAGCSNSPGATARTI